MDPKRKKLYIIIIVACLGLSAGVLVWSQSSPPQAPEFSLAPGVSQPALPPTNRPANTTNTSTIKKIDPDATYPPPSVFPLNNSFDTTSLSKLKLLQTFEALKLSNGDLGRENPFSNY